jgi:hypothetical protein
LNCLGAVSQNRGRKRRESESQQKRSQTNRHSHILAPTIEEIHPPYRVKPDPISNEFLGTFRRCDFLNASESKSKRTKHGKQEKYNLQHGD